MKRRPGTTESDATPVAREAAVQAAPKLDPTLTAPAELLRRFIEVAETGYAICVCNAPAERRRILDSLLPELIDKDIGIFELELDRSVETIPGRIRVALTTGAFRTLATRFSTVAISLTGAEATITDAERKSAGRPGVLQGLNQQRDWMDQLGHPIIFWVSEWLLGLLPRVAPDFWAGRSVVIEFPSAGEARAHAYQEISSGPWTFSSLDEARRKMRIYEDLLRGETEPRAKATFLHNLAIIHQSLGNYAKARELYDQSLATFKDLGAKSEQAAVLHQLAVLHQKQGDLTQARNLYDQSLAIKRELGSKSGIASTLHQLGNIAYSQGNYPEARELYNQSLAISKELVDKSGIASTLHQLAMLAHDQGDLAEARKLYDQSLAIAQELGDKSGIAQTLHQLAMLAQDQGDLAEARKLYDESLALNHELGNKSGIAYTLHQLGTLAQDQGDYDKAREPYNQSLAIEQELGDKSGIASTLGQLGRLAETEKDDRTALKDYLTALAIFEGLKSPYRDLAKQDIARMQQRLGDEAFKKLHDEVVAELSKEQADS